MQREVLVWGQRFFVWGVVGLVGPRGGVVGSRSVNAAVHPPGIKGQAEVLEKNRRVHAKTVLAAPSSPFTATGFWLFALVALMVADFMELQLWWLR